jgi:hypothetical protein
LGLGQIAGLPKMVDRSELTIGRELRSATGGDEE